MRRRLLALAVILVTAVAFVPMVGADDGGRPFTTTLTGAAEVPGPGDPDGSGTATLSLNPGKGEVCYELTVSGISPAIAAHVHVGTAGVAGPVVIPLVPPTNGSSSACTSASRELILAIIQIAGGISLYVGKT